MSCKSHHQYIASLRDFVIMVISAALYNVIARAFRPKQSLCYEEQIASYLAMTRKIKKIRWRNLFHSKYSYKSWILYLLCFISSIFFVSCGDDDEITIPKPKGYFRIDLPQKTYVKYDSICPFTFDFPNYAIVVYDNDKGAEPCWMNLIFPKFDATLHISYKQVNNNLKRYLDDSREFAIKHQIKASSMNENVVMRDSSKVYGLVYEIEGNVASSLQFYLTDSTQHFFRGALYFNVPPNSDSLAPVLNFVKADIYKMIQTFEWKGNKITLH